MRDIGKKIGLVANVATILVAVMLGVVLVKRFVLPGTNPRENDTNSVKLGSKITLPDIDWSKSNRNLVLVLQKNCHFCSESAPFYQRLARAAVDHPDFKLIAALPQASDEAKQYLSDLHVPIDNIRQAAPSSMGVRGTPTLLLVNASGAVEEVWVGKLPAEKEAEVLKRLSLN